MNESITPAQVEAMRKQIAARYEGRTFTMIKFTDPSRNRRRGAPSKRTKRRTIL